jgi:rod shape-determining protein MreC
MENKKDKISVHIVFTCLILVGLIVFFTPQPLTNKLQLTFFRIFKNPLSSFRNLAMAESKKKPTSNTVDQDNYIRLRNHLANSLQCLRQERQNIEQLTGLRQRYVWEGVNFVLADIITVFSDSSRSEFIINRGKNDGLAENQFVLGSDSIIGTIAELDSRTARVQLITDPRSKVAVKVGELDLQRIMHGSGDDTATIPLVSKRYKIEQGDIIYAEKKAGFLDVPMITAIVVQCKTAEENPLLWDIKVKPACDIVKLKNVAVIVMNPQEQLQADNTKKQDKQK